MQTKDVELEKPEQVAQMPTGLWLVRRENGRVLATLVEASGGDSREPDAKRPLRGQPGDEALPEKPDAPRQTKLPPSSLRKYIGTIALEGPTDVAANKHKYLGEYYGHSGD
jgi:hypothetical protein